jgi:hypothetical protein
LLLEGPLSLFAAAGRLRSERVNRETTMFGTAIDLISERPDGSFVLYLIEQGPWDADAMTHLHVIQDRVYACFDAAVDGRLAAGHPDVSGRPVVIRVDTYGTPPGKVAGFVRFLAELIARSPAHQDALRRSTHVTSVAFECVEKAVRRGGEPPS